MAAPTSSESSTTACLIPAVHIMIREPSAVRRRESLRINGSHSIPISKTTDALVLQGSHQTTNMEIIERKIVGKHNDDLTCEDGIIVTPDFIAVIDGSTSKTAFRFNPTMNNGRFCMLLISKFISGMPKDITLEDFCSSVTDCIHNYYRSDEASFLSHPERRMCASVVIYSKHRHEIWMIGDCQCMVDGVLHTNGKPSEARIANERTEVFATMVDKHPDMIQDGQLVNDYARKAVLPELIRSMMDENKTYAVIDGFPVYADGIKTISLDKGYHEVVLASDGYPFLCSTLQKSEAKLTKQLQNDPYNIQSFKATKGLMRGNVSFDDRAYIRFATGESQRYFIHLSFDGTQYHGWQIQPNGMSVQQKLQDCLSRLLRRSIEVTGAGRTDAGVHARTMVCHFDYAGPVDEQQLCYRLNQILPCDISCNSVEKVSSEMHARFSAKWRTYHYFIHTRKDPFLRHYSVETHYALDFDLMNEAAAYLLQVDDFKAFCKAGADNKTTLCKVTAARWIQTGPSTWYFEITANRFLRNMVRAVVGTLFDVGRHVISLEEFRDIVNNGTRSDSGESMPAHGLFLWDIKY